MKNRIIIPSLITALMMAAIPAFTQIEQPQSKVSSVFKLDILLPGISYEQKLLPYSTLNFDAYMDALILSKSETNSNQAHVYFTPSFKTEFRNYYNLNKRNQKGLRTALNSGNYIAPLYIGRYSPVADYADHEWVSQLGAVWGMQRNTPNGFSFDLNLGLVHTFNKNSYYYYSKFITPVFQLRLGYWIGRKTN
jgi:hypothetical protein